MGGSVREALRRYADSNDNGSKRRMEKMAKVDFGTPHGDYDHEYRPARIRALAFGDFECVAIGLCLDAAISNEEFIRRYGDFGAGSVHTERQWDFREGETVPAYYSDCP